MIKNLGKIKQVIGPVVDVEFEGDLPPILNALHINQNNQRIVLIKIPHLSRYSIKNYKEVIDWIKAVSAEKNETTLLN